MDSKVKAPNKRLLPFQKARLAEFAEQRIADENLDVLTREVLGQVLKCVRSVRLGEPRLHQILTDSADLINEAVPGLDLITQEKPNCPDLNLEVLRGFIQKNHLELNHKDDLSKIIRSIFYGSWEHLSKWDSGSEIYRKAFPGLRSLINITSKIDGNTQLKMALKHSSFLLDTMQLSPGGLSLLLSKGYVEHKITQLKKPIKWRGAEMETWKFLTQNAGLSHSQIAKLLLKPNFAQEVEDLKSRI